MLTKIALVGLLVGAGYAVNAMTTPEETYTKEIEIPEGGTLYQEVAKAASSKDNINDVVWKTLNENGMPDAGMIRPGIKFIITLKK